MVSCDIINKSLDRAIWKCSQGFRLDKKITGVLDKFHNETCGENFRKTEKAILINNKGDTIYSKNGGKHSVKIDDRNIVEDYKEYGELHITHNHPRRLVEESLSPSDVQLIYDGAYIDNDYKYLYKSISCESPNGSRMTLVRGDSFNDDNITDVNMLASRLEDYSNKYETDFYNIVFRLKDEHPYEHIVNEDMRTAGERYSAYVTHIQDLALKELGAFEKQSEFKEIQKGFSNANCKLTYTYPSDYNIGELVVV